MTSDDCHAPLLQLVLLAAACVATAKAQSSFAATKFDLSPALPEEDIIVAGLSQDAKPTQLDKKSGEIKEPSSTKAPKERKRNRTTTTTTVPITTVPTTIVITTTLLPTEAVSVNIPVTEKVTLATVEPLLQQQGKQQQSGAIQQQQLFRQAPQQESGSMPRPLRADEWFREDFDTADCPSDGNGVAEAFKRKFPHNLLRDGKETVLAELLATRIRACREKHDQRHWSRIDAIVAQSTDVAATEREDCVAGLIEEQIACMNVISYSCQFIQPSYAFRLLPTRIIVQEARYAEEGADKCRKFVRKLPRGQPPA